MSLLSTEPVVEPELRDHGFRGGWGVVAASGCTLLPVKMKRVSRLSVSLRALLLGVHKRAPCFVGNSLICAGSRCFRGFKRWVRRSLSRRFRGPRSSTRASNFASSLEHPMYPGSPVTNPIHDCSPVPI